MNNLKKNKLIYEQKLKESENKLLFLNKKISLFSNVRLGLFTGTIITGAGAIWGDWFSLWTAALPFVLFAATVFIHDYFFRLHKQEESVRDFYKNGLLRMNEKWAGKGNIATDYEDASHIYAGDLDIFGKGSLFEYMCTAGTRAGEEQLARWLCKSSTAIDIIDRQGAVKELKNMVDLRRDIFIASNKMRSILNPLKLKEWALAPPAVNKTSAFIWRILFLFLALLALFSSVLCFYSDFGLAFLAGVAIAEWITGRIFLKYQHQILSGLEGPRRQLKVMSDILLCFENADVKSSLLLSLKKKLIEPDRASAKVYGLGRIMDWLDQAKNQVFAPIAFLLMWIPHFSLIVEKWRVSNGNSINDWIEAAGHLEALCSISGYAFEHPDDIFPEIVNDNKKNPVFYASKLGHPLISKNESIQNDVKLDKENAVMIVSGSNMSGKSTYLRTIGINAVIAMAGGPVRALTMMMTPVNIGSTIRIQDSLQKGASRFYAEISTLKEIVDLAKNREKPLLFLLDEIFHGTNSHDRKIGAEAVIYQLVESGSIGLVTTHDLTLASMIEKMGSRARNVHFDDQVKDGVLHFDYTLKEGPVTRSNAIELMRTVGLDV